jgi:hypothetical protein
LTISSAFALPVRRERRFKVRRGILVLIAPQRAAQHLARGLHDARTRRVCLNALNMVVSRLGEDVMSREYLRMMDEGTF